MTRRALVAWLGLAMAACAAPVGNDAATIDAAELHVADSTDEAVDAFDGAIGDVRDGSTLDTEGDAVDAPADAALEDVVIDPGLCGRSVRDCLCGCGADAACQTGCITTAPDDCQFCLYGAAMNCCPAEDSAYGMCIDRFMCMDQPCVDMNCASQQSEFNTCFQRRQTSVAACTMEVQTCLGSDYPMVRCVMAR